MKKYLFLILFSFPIFISNQVFSQRPQYSGGAYSGTFSGSVSGTIMDGETNTPLEYVSVALLKKKDSTIVNGVLTDNKGAFTIAVSTPGMFVLKYSFVGYKNGFVDSVLVTPRKTSVNLGNVVLKTTTKNIDAVVVKGNSTAIEYKIDKKVVDVSSNLVAASGSVIDALQNTPSVQTDVEGNLTLRGSSNFTVLIDGKPSPISGSDALQQIPASLVQSVEIITNPSAKYDAEGAAGIINVIMKKQKISGFNGIINLTAGTGDKYSGNVNINYKVSKFNFTVGGDWNDMSFSNTMFNSSYKVLNKNKAERDSFLSQTVNSNGIFERMGGGVKLGVDYNVNDMNTISLSGNYGSRNMKRDFKSTNFDEYIYEKSGQSDSIYYNGKNNSSGNHKYYYNVNLDYQIKLDTKGQQLSASAYYSQGPDDDITDLTQDTTDSKWIHIKKKNILNQYSDQGNFEKELRTKLDYTLPIGEKGKLEAGYQGKYYNNEANYIFKNISRVDSTKKDSIIDSQTNTLSFTDNIQAFYASYSNSKPIVDFQIGLRAEYEYRDIHLQNGTKSKIDTINLFPSLYLTRQLPWDLQLQANYTRRVTRPRNWDLNPLPRMMSPTNYRKGNSGLKPEFTNSYELNLQKKINDASFVSLEGFYRRTDNKMQDTAHFDAPTKTTTTYSVNIDYDQSTGVEFMINLAPARWFVFNSSGSVYDYRLYNKLSKPSQKNTSWNIRVNPSFRFPTGTSVQVNYIYNGPTKTLQGDRSAFYNSSVGIRQDLLNHKASLTLNIQNPFGLTRMSSTTKTYNSDSYNYFQRESKVVMLTFTYRFNNYKAAQQNKKPQEDMNNNGGDSEFGM